MRYYKGYNTKCKHIENYITTSIVTQYCKDFNSL